MNPPTVAELAAKLIASFEGCLLEAYQDQGGVWTIGFGHTGDIWPGEPVTRGTTITMEQAAELLQQDAAPLLRLVLDKPLVAAAAYVSFGYNCGIGSLGKVLAGGNLLDYNHIHGVVNDGLTRRRELEDALIRSAF